MRQSRFTETSIIGMIKEQEAGMPTAEVCRRHVAIAKSVRDLLHQDRLGAREDIDWHSMCYEEAFLPALSVMRGLLRQHSDRFPEQTILLG